MSFLPPSELVPEVSRGPALQHIVSLHCLSIHLTCIFAVQRTSRILLVLSLRIGFVGGWVYSNPEMRPTASHCNFHVDRVHTESRCIVSYPHAHG